jgi:hypothetical protein
MASFLPEKVLKDNKIEEEKINALANMVVLNEKANRTFTSFEPKEYLKRHNVKKERLLEQLIPCDDEELFLVKNYSRFLEKRASLLANAANSYMTELKGG